MIELYSDRIQKDVGHLENLIKLGQSLQFDDKTYSDYGKTKYVIYSPSVGNITSTFPEFTGEAKPRNVSVIEITNSMLIYIDVVRNSIPHQNIYEFFSNSNTNITNSKLLSDSIMKSDYMNPLKTYDFTFLWSNKEIFSHVFQDFCTTYMERSKELTFDLMLYSEIYFIVVLGVDLMFGFALVFYVAYNNLFFNRLVRVLEKQLSKDIIGRIYQQLVQKSTVEASLSSSTVAKLLK